MGPSTLNELLHTAARSRECLVFYGCESTAPPKVMTYQELEEAAKKKSLWLRRHLLSNKLGPVVLLHFSRFEETMLWFWASVLADALPAVSVPLPSEVGRRKRHLEHLAKLLTGPLVVTATDVKDELSGVGGLCIINVDDHRSEGDVFDLTNEKPALATESSHRSSHGLAALMLTSGSSGNAKAVALRHEQICASVHAKSQYFGTTAEDKFLNWIGFDHVASVIETHIHAMSLSAGFFHVPASRLLTRPLEFVELIERHQISYTFAPQFFLARLVREHSSNTVKNSQRHSLRLSSLRSLISGGESNIIETIESLTKILQAGGVKNEVIHPGFGMTETCAGSIYSKACPSIDRAANRSVASVGKPIPGVYVIVRTAEGVEARPGEVGSLLLSGAPILKAYYNDPEATEKSFTDDGWLRTGDLAYVDDHGDLCMAGREKETISLNGIEFAFHEIELALENANLPGLEPSYTLAFSESQNPGHPEKLCIVYHPTFDRKDYEVRSETSQQIIATTASITACRPSRIVPLPKALLPKSSLGKLSRAKIKTACMNGDFEAYADDSDSGFRRSNLSLEQPKTVHEIFLAEVIASITGTDVRDISVSHSLFSYGITSLDLFNLKVQMEKRLEKPNSVSIGSLLLAPSIGELARTLDLRGNKTVAGYDPVVILNHAELSTKVPMWLVHPGSGDVIIFVGLSKYLSDRTVYGLRTKGLDDQDENGDYFRSIEAMTDCYTASIKKHQANGPYALAGYSLGSTVAFEIAKRLEWHGDQVIFLGVLDSPPRIRPLIQPLRWNDVLLNVAYFLSLIAEDDQGEILAKIQGLGPQEAVEKILACANADRKQALAMDHVRLRKLTDVTNAFRLAANVYEPKGIVQNLDAFWVTPLMAVAPNRQIWMENHLVQWKEFSNQEPRFHECEGTHSRMLNSEHLHSFQKTFRTAMRERGL